MSDKALDTIINNAAHSVEMEGFCIDEQSRRECKRLINNEITIAEYIVFAKKKAGLV